jgi:metallo-beta-lactamase family protein
MSEAAFLQFSYGIWFYLCPRARPLAQQAAPTTSHQQNKPHMKFISFGSGSSGNCYYLLEDGIGLIIDAGIGIRSFKKYFREYGFTYPTLKAILVTHDHTDHVKAVGALSGEYNLEVFATEEVHKGILNNYYTHKKVRPELCRTYLPGDDWSIGPFHITTFTVPHDASHNCGYFIETATTNFCFITDAGSFTPEMISFIRRARNLVIEANYDAAMLDEGPYPLHLKKRIKAPTGHACNAETARILEENLAATTENIWLCHLSEENNHPELARKTIAQALERSECKSQLHVLRRRIPSGPFEL